MFMVFCWKMAINRKKISLHPEKTTAQGLPLQRAQKELSMRLAKCQ
jgi:hypothetical protein